MGRSDSGDGAPSVAGLARARVRNRRIAPQAGKTARRAGEMARS